MNVKNIEKEGSKAKITLEIEGDLMDAGAATCIGGATASVTFAS